MRVILLTMVAWALTAAVSLRADQFSDPSFAKANAEDREREAEEQKAIEAGRSLFGVDERWDQWRNGHRPFLRRTDGDPWDKDKRAAGTLPGKYPPDFKIGDWGCTTETFRVINKVSDTECLVMPKYGGSTQGQWQRRIIEDSAVMLLRGFDMKKVTDGVEFVLQHPIVIQTTYNYVSVAGAKKTVLVLENDEEKLNKLIEAAERPFREKQKAAEAKRQAEKEHKAAVEAAKWRTWTDSSGKHKIKAKFSGVISGIVKLVKEDGSAVRIPLEKLSDEDRKWIANPPK